MARPQKKPFFAASLKKGTGIQLTRVRLSDRFRDPVLSDNISQYQSHFKPAKKGHRRKEKTAFKGLINNSRQSLKYHDFYHFEFLLEIKSEA